MKIYLMMIIALILILTASLLAEEQGKIEEKEAAAVEACLLWLEIVDNGDYEASWEETSDFFRQSVEKEQWKASLNNTRDPLGEMLLRELKSTYYSTSLPNAPEGEYFIIQFKTTFENRKEAIETLTPILDEDGDWKVSGYYIR